MLLPRRADPAAVPGGGRSPGATRCRPLRGSVWSGPIRGHTQRVRSRQGLGRERGRDRQWAQVSEVTKMSCSHVVVTVTQL